VRHLSSSKPQSPRAADSKHWSVLRYTLALIAVVALSAVFVSQGRDAVASGAPLMYWADWEGGDLDPGAAFQGRGTITTSTATINVQYDNPQGILDVPSDSPTPTYGFDTGAANGGLDRWGRYGDNLRVPATSPYTSDQVANIPPDTDMIRLRYAGPQTLTFTDSGGAPVVVANPVFAFVSLNLNGYGFDQDFDILSAGGADGNDCGRYGCGTSYKTIETNPTTGATEYWLRGTGEPHGTIRFRGSFSTLNWDSLGNEVWNGFNVGIAGLAAELPDTDGDGFTDDVDEFPADPSEWADFDGDGVGDNADAFPFDASETTDTDGDGVGDNSDAFPNDPSESSDSDGDGIGDNADSPPTVLSRSDWQMLGNNPIVSGVPNFGTHGDPRYYDYVPPVPGVTDPRWGPAPNPATIGFGSGTASRLPGCWTYLDYTFFQTLVEIPTGTTLTSFTIDFSGMDDGSRITVFNSANPGGLVIPGSYVYLGRTGTSDLAPYMVIGETNRVVITQIDDCAVGNNLQTANVVLNGDVITPEPENFDPELISVGTSVDEGSTASTTGSVSDSDGDTVALSASSGTVVNNNDGSWDWTGSAPEADGPASYDVTVTGDDGNGGSASTTFTVNVNNVAPVVVAGSGLTLIDDFTSGTAFTGPACHSVGYATHSDSSIAGGKRQAVVIDGHSCVTGNSPRASYDAGSGTAEWWGKSVGNSAVGQWLAYGTAIGQVSKPWAVNPEIANNPQTPLNLALSTGSTLVLDMGQVDPDTPNIHVRLVAGNGASYGAWFPVSTGINNIPLGSIPGLTDAIAADIDGLELHGQAGGASVTPGNGHIFNSIAITSGSLSEGDTFNSTGSFTDPGADTWTATVDYGDGSGVQPLALTGKDFVLSHVYGDNGTYTVTVTVTDDDNGVGSTTLEVTVSNVDPIANAGGPYVGPEGTTIALSGQGSDVPADTLTFEWDLDNDGTFETPGQNVTFDAVDDIVQIVALRVTDDDGGSDVSTTTVTVLNVDPVADAGGPYNVPEGGSVALSGTGTDVPADTLTFEWDLDDDGTFEFAGANPTFDASLIDGGTTVDVAVRVTDDDGGVDEASTTVTVRNVAPTITEINAVGTTENGEVTVTGTISDPAPADTFTVEIDWGGSEGSSPATVTGNTFSATHQYLDDNPTGTSSDLYLITAVATDDDNGVSAPASVGVTITNVAPVIESLVGDDENGGVSVVFSDIGSEDSHTVVIAWGDGDSESVAIAAGDAKSASAEHLFPQFGTYTVTVTVTDDDGGSALNTVDLIIGGGACECSKSQGWWKQQFNENKLAKGKTELTPDQIDLLLEMIGDQSELFAGITLAGAQGVFDPPKSNNRGGNGDGSRSGRNDASATASGSKSKKKGKNKKGSNNNESSASSILDLSKFEEKALMQTLAAWGNYAKGAIDWDEVIDTNGKKAGGEMTFGDLITEVESLLSSENPTKADLERAKDLAEAVNLHDKDNPDCETGTGSSKSGSGSDSGSGSNSGSGGGNRWGKLRR
jgi:hypothetical protein